MKFNRKDNKIRAMFLMLQASFLSIASNENPTNIFKVFITDDYVFFLFTELGENLQKTLMFYHKSAPFTTWRLRTKTTPSTFQPFSHRVTAASHSFTSASPV